MKEKERGVALNGDGLNSADHGDHTHGHARSPSATPTERRPTTTTTTATASTSPAPKSKLASLLPPWLMTALKTKRTWKNWARSMIALFVATLLMVITPTSKALGSSATFFALIACAMLPPMMPVSILIFALITLGLGMLLGWAWGVAAWAAAHSVRDQARLQTAMQGVQAQAQASGADPRAANQAAIFHGVFLDPGVSAVHGVFIFIGAYFLGWVRATRPKLTLLAIYGTILLDMNSTFGPLFPNPYYMLATALLKPAAAYMAVAIACAVLFFPQSLSHLVLSGLVQGTYRPMLALLRLQERILTTDPTQHEEWHALAEEARGLAKGYVAAYSDIAGQAKMLQIEVTRGRISAGQLTEVINRTRALIAASVGLGTVVGMVDERDRALKAQVENPLPYATSRSKNMYERVITSEKGAGSNLEDLLPELKAETADLRAAAEGAFAGGIDFLDVINNSRWKKTPKSLPGPEARQANLARLRASLATFRASGNSMALERFRTHFDADTGRLLEWEGKAGGGSPRGLFRCFQFTATLTGFCLALIDWLELLELIELGTPANKFQFPGKFVQEVVRTVNDSSAQGEVTGLSARGDVVDGHDDDDDDTLSHDRGADRKPKYGARDPDAGPPRNALQKVGRVVSAMVRAATGVNGIFALKYGIVSVAFWVPSVCPSSAAFYYRNRGLWALIMAQTGLGVYAGEQVFVFVQRMSGTCAGIVVGMVLWYIGAQRGMGNAYGVTAAFVVGMSPFLFLRIVAPPQVQSFFVMMAVTSAFVVGYSWVDNHTVSSANQGVGYTLAGRRALLVIIGFAGAFIMILIPRPISAKKVVRQSMAKNIGALGDMYALELASLEAARTERGDAASRRAKHRDHFLRIFSRLQTLHQRLAYASFEPAIRGPWPRAQYEKLIFIQESMLASSALLTAAYSQLEPEWCERITDRSDLMHPAFVADLVSLFALLRHSLRQATPLPPVLPIFERLSYHRTYRHALRRAARLETGAPADSRDAPVESGLMPQESSALVSLEGDLTWSNAHNEQFTLYATALIALSHFIGGLNSLHATVLELVGEREIDGFAEAQERWARAEMSV
ncbi:hypothetical protein CC85DRAFT_328300 [Cutaneotrichosporon oleaginosum]|uniref:ER transporter 6TM N-terminal domain-containing protein n=1 Tax=Cutaneotrichosporon oleaginosum TaxID=879819 RepID=A0A0J1B3K4_9TREE|nr:uncharacterized protein CC85DRAFT_328300 [Cutaneotrichosporon oleaginosum]KLT42229.1 hypothetical protein CC85DRAFT_328300 [Cutaneotrichosporon oleaginosum]TXT11403.1 hypothetical protein COLE_01813 [Cutaneotrichosporon oleaginosum]